ncbi:histidine kinase [Methylocella silvestris BL2]|uniref:histidine kinase n=1 Tax=Methylocella silvestris (strain DSM 15510 / CIP 108128 / LMG 27833 / NCIMB 13906 / BL2) TaxID=395965 RepID=B8ES01_METSB|nr:ATP-binding protein [Methylocella silvestris]ACK51699.1 histidine kinase [Methylocella silvestris BL2]
MEIKKEITLNPVLVCAPFGRDGETLADLLHSAGYHAQVHPNLRVLVDEIGERVGSILVTEEALTLSGVLGEALALQPPWSDIPVLLLISRQKSGRFPVDGLVGRTLIEITNVVLLERPLGARSLLSAVEVALRNRQRQFALRDQMELLAQSHEALEAKVQERSAELEQEVAQRSRAEAALRQSQKMEAVGQLTGGIAHDFNNMLTGVIGSLDIMRRRIASHRLEDLDRFMDAAAASANRAAGLTQRLLAFSRRQSLDAKPTDINGLVASLEQLIRGSLDERVQLQFVLDPHLPRAVVDVNQLENALLNLAINARDAMPEGGRLTIETSAVDLDEACADERYGTAVGAYVIVAVSDTGVGMPPDVLEKVFDPFFTTKPLGQGTGLGLSMVYGFARQSGGQVRIHSQPGAGSTVKIYLPATEAGAVVEPPVEGSAPHGDGQRVLVVEDDPAVRMLVREVLEELGYMAVEAAEPHAAIPLLASSTPFDLLISDVGLPGMNGRELAEIARSYRPELPILFITGYAENAAIRAAFLGTNMSMVTKPFRLDDLAAKVSEMITRR